MQFAINANKNDVCAFYINITKKKNECSVIVFDPVSRIKNIEDILIAEETMKTKIFVLLLAVLLLAGSTSFAGDQQKPFNGWAEEVGDPIPIDPLDYPYLKEIIDQYGPPSVIMYPRLLTYEGNNTVGGKSTYEHAVIFYFFPLPDFSRFVLLYYVDETITVANGDKIFGRISGVYYSSIDKLVDKGIIDGGTGRFEEAEGERTSVFFSDAPIAVFEGYIKY